MRKRLGLLALIFVAIPAAYGLDALHFRRVCMGYFNHAGLSPRVLRVQHRFLDSEGICEVSLSAAEAERFSQAWKLSRNQANYQGQLGPYQGYLNRLEGESPRYALVLATHH